MNAPLLATREALAAALCEAWDHAWPTERPCRECERTAVALLASGVVRDPATLADDDALLARAQELWWEQGAKGGWPAIMRALAAALTEGPS